MSETSRRRPTHRADQPDDVVAVRADRSDRADATGEGAPEVDRTRHTALLRILLPALLVLGWLALFSVGGMSFGRIGDVATNDRSSFLPASAASTQVAERQPDFLGSDAVPAIIVVEREGGVTEEDLAALQALADDAPGIVGEGAEASPPIPSEDGEAAQLVVTVPSDQDAETAIEALRTALAEDLPDGAHAWVTGPAGFSADLVEAFGGIDGILLLVTIAAVFVILVIVYRSPVLPILVMLAALTALAVAVLINVELAAHGIVTINGQIQGILFILVIGAATDYSLLYIARYREELREHESPARAALAAWRGTLEPILASGGTVIVGLLCLLLSDLVSNSALGPVAAIGIVCAMACSLTFLPAMLVLTGRAAFWPRIPRAGEPHPEGGVWHRLGPRIAAAPRRISVIVLVLLVLGCAGLLRLDASGVPQSEFVLGASEARDGQEALDRHFAGGSGSPASIIVPEGALAEAAQDLAGIDGVDSLAVVSQDSPAGSVPLGEDGKPVAQGPFAGAEPTVVDGDVMLEATLSDPADSRAAEDTVVRMREALAAGEGTQGALVGGTTAIDLDTNTTAEHDRTLIIPIVLAAITVMLALLLRSIVAPLVLLATTVLSFGTALGISAVIFDLIGQGASDPTVPLYGFVFLVALGIDYNIFLMSRVREESLVHGTVEGTKRGLALTGGVITSAGVVLAVTFAALAVIPIQFLLQLAIIVALGVLIDALVVRSFLVPALAIAIGDRIWWPARVPRER
ncbi:MMPL family transporter [Brachybacterium huguangmaarense]